MPARGEREREKERLLCLTTDMTWQFSVALYLFVWLYSWPLDPAGSDLLVDVRDKASCCQTRADTYGELNNKLSVTFSKMTGDYSHVSMWLDEHSLIHQLCYLSHTQKKKKDVKWHISRHLLSCLMTSLCDKPSIIIYHVKGISPYHVTGMFFFF